MIKMIDDREWELIKLGKCTAGDLNDMLVCIKTCDRIEILLDESPVLFGGTLYLWWDVELNTVKAQVGDLAIAIDTRLDLFLLLRALQDNGEVGFDHRIQQREHVTWMEGLTGGLR